MSEPNDFNAKIIDEFRANGGKAGMFSTAWYHNLLANPQARTRQKQVAPQFAQYEQKTERQIPVLILDPVG